jgi:hypothetical protein
MPPCITRMRRSAKGVKVLSSKLASLTKGQVLICSNRIAKLQLTVPIFTHQADVFLRGPVPDMVFPRVPTNATYQLRMDRVNDGMMTEGVREQIARTLREFKFTPRGHARVYQKPYRKYIDTIPYLRGFWVPDFMKFTGDDARLTYEHVG